MGFNELLEEQPTKLTDAEIAAGKTEVGLSHFNQKVVDCFKNHIKYNTYLVHLDLKACGLIAPALKYLAALLRKSQALRVFHLDGNKGIDDELVAWIEKRIHAKTIEPGFIVPASKTQYKDPQ